MSVFSADIVGSTGVALLLLAFVLLQLNRLDKDGWVYLTMNMVGAGLACLSSYMIDFMPFVVLEGVWAVSSMIALIKLARGPILIKGDYR